MEFDVLRTTLLAIIQGLTEFLPISSSAHLILPSALLGWDDQGLGFDVAVHLGTLTAVVLYFRQDILVILGDCLRQVTGGGATPESRLGWQLLAATLPVIIAGYLAKDLVESSLRATVVIAATTIGFGLLLYWADRRSRKQTSLSGMTWKTVLIIGFAQVLALVPGTSRSGITMTAGLFCNLDRESSSRFSFLLSIPVIAGAAFLQGLELLQQAQVDWAEIAWGMGVAGFVAYGCIYFFLHTINRIGFLPFVLYRLVLGITLFLFFI